MELSINKLEITIIIPAYNEEKTIGSTLKSLKTIKEIDSILVVDDGSTDNTSIVTKSLGVNLYKIESNQGKAYAMRKGFELAKTPVIVFLDADLGSSANEVIKLCRPVCYNKADVAIAVFNKSSIKGGFGLVRKLADWGLKALTGRSIKAVLSGQRAFKRSILSIEYFNYSGFGIEFGMTVDLLKTGARLLEIELDMEHRVTYRDFYGFLHRGKQFKDISKVIISKMIQKRFGLL